MTAKNKNDVECVIYDCDGVLFDSLDANRRLYNKIAAATGRGELSPAELQYCHTHTVYEAIRHLFPGDAGKEKQALEVLKNVDFREFIVFLKMEPNLIETLEGLKKRGIKRAICTNRTTSMKHVVEKFCLAPYFDMVVTALDVEHPKPHPSAVEKILQELGVEKERVFFLGDSEVDRETAVSAGVRFISYKNCE
ncbi:MAG TPA: HAD-IA family hydrolase, partial [Syntrophorhabdaceae bacterium]